MADKRKVVPNNPGGDEKELSPPPPPEKKQKIGEGDMQSSISEGSSASKTSLGLHDEEVDPWDAAALEWVLSEKDHALDDVTSTLNERYPGGRCDDPGDKWFKYMKQIVDSEGFDIEIDELPEDDFMHHLSDDIGDVPFYPSRDVSPWLIESAKVAINHFNQNEGTNYKFVRVVKANAGLWCHGSNSYITFQAVREDSDPFAGLTTFQALVWTGPEPFSPYVKFVRPKTELSCA